MTSTLKIVEHVATVKQPTGGTKARRRVKNSGWQFDALLMRDQELMADRACCFTAQQAGGLLTITSNLGATAAAARRELWKRRSRCCLLRTSPSSSIASSACSEVARFQTLGLVTFLALAIEALVIAAVFAASAAAFFFCFFVRGLEELHRRGTLIKEILPQTGNCSRLPVIRNEPLSLLH